MRSGVLSLLSIHHMNQRDWFNDYAQRNQLPANLNEIKLFLREKTKQFKYEAEEQEEG